jgi:hypothetical protein
MALDNGRRRPGADHCQTEWWLRTDSCVRTAPDRYGLDGQAADTARRRLARAFLAGDLEQADVSARRAQPAGEARRVEVSAPAGARRRACSSPASPARGRPVDDAARKARLPVAVREPATVTRLAGLRSGARQECSREIGARHRPLSSGARYSENAAR